MTHILQPLNVEKPVTLFYVIAGSHRCGGVGEGERCDGGLLRGTRFGFYYPLRSFSLGN